MTDNEIIKALECCRSSRDLTACKGCPALEYDLCAYGTNVLSEGLVNELVDLINRLKSENEGLISAQESLQKHIEKAKTEAIKEVIGRLQKSITSQLDVSTLEQKAAYCFCLDEIDEIELELVGDIYGQAN